MTYAQIIKGILLKDPEWQNNLLRRWLNSGAKNFFRLSMTNSMKETADTLIREDLRTGLKLMIGGGVTVAFP